MPVQASLLWGKHCGGWQYGLRDSAALIDAFESDISDEDKSAGDWSRELDKGREQRIRAISLLLNALEQIKLDSKLATLMELVNELREAGAAVLFTSFRDTALYVHSALTDSGMMSECCNTKPPHALRRERLVSNRIISR